MPDDVTKPDLGPLEGRTVPASAEHLLKAMAALIAEDVTEAFHQLYYAHQSLPNADPFEPWRLWFTEEEEKAALAALNLPPENYIRAEQAITERMAKDASDEGAAECCGCASGE